MNGLDGVKKLNTEFETLSLKWLLFIWVDRTQQCCLCSTTDGPHREAEGLWSGLCGGESWIQTCCKRTNYLHCAKVRRRRKRGGLTRIKRQKQWCIPLPSLILASVQLLRNRYDELLPQSTYMYTEMPVIWPSVRHSSCQQTLTRIWQSADSECLSDKDTNVMGKSKEGGDCVYMCIISSCAIMSPSGSPFVQPT